MGWGFRVIFSFYTLLEQMALLWLFLAILFGTFSVKTGIRYGPFWNIFHKKNKHESKGGMTVQTLIYKLYNIFLVLQFPLKRAEYLRIHTVHSAAGSKYML
jgi:hypothetical protein